MRVTRRKVPEIADQRVRRAHDVLPERGHQRVLVAFRDRIDDGHVLFELGWQPRLPVAMPQVNAGDLDMRIQTVVHLHEALAARQRNDVLVELDVPGGVGQARGFRIARLGNRDRERTQPRDVVWRGSLEPFFRRETLRRGRPR